MTLAAGARLGVYDIVALIGAGGPPPLARGSMARELWRDLAVAQEART